MTRRPDEHIRFLVAALGVGLAPHVLVLPLWIVVWCVCAWGLILWLDWKKKGLPPRLVQWLLTLMAFTAILVTSRGRFSGDSGIGLLCLMASLKPLEIKGPRDRMIILFLAYFMVAAGLFFSTSLEMSLYLFFSVIVITGLLIRVNYPGMGLPSGLRLSSFMTVQALPLALILFVAFPRIQGGIWGIQQRPRGLVGLSSTLSPGSLAGLGRNEAVAFRASFEGDIPSASRRYWRAMVYESFDGRRWRLVRGTPPAVNRITGASSLRYEVIMEPHSERWLFALDYPTEVDAPWQMLSDFTLRARQRIVSKTRYSATSVLVSMTGEGDTSTWITRFLPPGRSPRARDLATVLRGENGSDQAVVDAALAYIHDEPFYYSLNPPLLGSDPVDDFLFRTREGYCEHYASAFAVLMRAAGIPARIVGGYLGGEVNPYGNYLIVRQSHAHAWVEVWMEKKGWIRVDPTAAVARERVETGTRGAGQGDDQGSRDETAGQSFFGDLADNLVLGWDSLNYLWYSRVISYSAQSQKQLFERLGLPVGSLGDWLKIIGAALVLIAGLTLLYFMNVSIRRRRTREPVTVAYERFLRRLEKVGVRRLPFEGPETFAERACGQRPDLKLDITLITRAYVLLRYGGHGNDVTLINDLRERARHFRPQKNKTMKRGAPPLTV